MIGLCGSHRTGKTSLAKAYAQQIEVPFIETSVSAIFKTIGLDPKADYPLYQRLAIQMVILEQVGKIYDKSGRVFVADRTPIDMLAYTLADIQRNNVPSDLEKKIQQYFKDCVSLTNKHFSTLIVVQPGVPIADEEGKAPATYSYMEHINSLVLGLVVNEEVSANHFMIPRRMTDFESRVICLDSAVKKSMERFAENRKSLEESGTRFH